MPILTTDEYIQNRQNYNYNAPDCLLEINQTGNLPNNVVGVFNGIYSHGNGFTMRKLEIVVQSVFEDCCKAGNENMGEVHIGNLGNIVSTVAHWKNYSQGGRGVINRDNVLNQWNVEVAYRLMSAYRAYLIKRDCSIKLFEIPGYRIPTASALLRFMFPERYGIVDSRIVNNITNERGLTEFSVRADGYITDIIHNRRQYDNVYTNLLMGEADWLNSEGVKFIDPDNYVQGMQKWRASDVEMALWQHP